MNVLQITENCPAGLPEQQIGNWRIKHADKEVGIYDLHDQIPKYDHYELTEPGRITLLQEKRNGRWQDWMTDDFLYVAAMKKIAEASHGNVLVGGLGLGLVHQYLAENPEVECITTIERQPEVVELNWPLCKNQSGRFLVLVRDFFDYAKGRYRYDTVVTDFWVGAPWDQEVQDLFLKTFEHVNTYWPDAQQFYHGIQPWYRILKPLWDCGVYETLRPEQKRGLLQSVLHPAGAYS